MLDILGQDNIEIEKGEAPRGFIKPVSISVYMFLPDFGRE